ncbi:MAG: leucine-rich repeat protein [Clostridiales bacterium]|nr:leucine-rich repeat protein [Clostridiales bacterium]
MKTRKLTLILLILVAIASMTAFAVSCGKTEAPPKIYTMSFETYGGTEIKPIKAKGGSAIVPPSDPEKEDNIFVGWYADGTFGGEAVKIPTVMPHKDVTYHAKFVPNPPEEEYSVIYIYNLGRVPHSGSIDNGKAKSGGKVVVADGNDYGVPGYMFLGWSIYPNGLVSVEKEDGQFNPGDEITLTDSDVTLFAQWAVGYTDARSERTDTIFVYEALVDKGRGAAMLVRAGETTSSLDGFVASGSVTESGYDEFTFYSEQFDGGVFEGRLYDNHTYMVADGMQGEYVYYDYVHDRILYGDIIAVDGFGYAVHLRLVGDILSIQSSGLYEYNAEYGDYTYLYTRITDAPDAEPQMTYFNLSKTEVDGTEFSGVYAEYGDEGGSYAGYYDPFVLELSGYGGATLYIYDDNGENVLQQISGVYLGTDFYESYLGEWKFVPLGAANAAYAFNFILDYVQTSDTEYFPIFISRDETMFGTFTSDDDEKSVLFLDGYGMGEYTSGGVTYTGTVTVENGIVEFTVLKEQDGMLVPGDNVFVFVLTGNKFSLSRDGIIVNENGVLTTYMGKSSAVEIPSVVNGYTVVKIGDDAFNYVGTEVSLVSVTVPETVTEIGARAFQNNNTLRRVMFLSSTPAAFAFDTTDDAAFNANDPFRWGAGDFLIVVPQDAVDTYKAAWPRYENDIIGYVDATTLPEFDIKDGVLVRYNKPDDKQGQIVDLVIPDEVTEIADRVFLGISGIRSVDLNNVETIGGYAFYGSADLEVVKFTNVKTIGEMAFSACYKLNNSGEEDVLTLPSIVTIGEYAFSGCESLRLVRLGADVAEIGDLAFYECNVYESDPPLFLELLGDDAPTMGGKIDLGNIAFRIKIKNIDVALNCFAEPTWSKYNKHLYIESGDEKGMYVCGDQTLELDGRAIYASTYLWLYTIDGENMTFYEYDMEIMTYYTLDGVYKNGVISITLGDETLDFVRADRDMTFTTADGKYTLTCNPMDLQPESYEGFSGYADVTFNGKRVQLYVSGYNIKMIYEYEEDGTLYDISISFDAGVLVVSKTPSVILCSDITAPDGSKISIMFKGNFIYIVTAEFEIEVDVDRKLSWTEASGMGVIAAKEGNVFTFSFRFRNDTYRFTATVSEDYKTFTYKYTKS